MLAFVLSYLIIGAALIAAARQKRWHGLRQITSGLLITYVLIAAMLLAGEAYFRFVYAASDGLPTLALQNWQARYWQLNEVGYRDIDWTAEALADRQTVYVVGDSFTAGWGLENIKDRFSSVLAAQLGDAWAVVNLGAPGASTADSLDNLKQSPLPDPDVVILQYTLNDIEDAALSIGLDPGLNPFADLPAIIHDSYLANFLYWRFAPVFNPEARGGTRYQTWMYEMYDHSVVWGIHRQELQDFVDYVNLIGAELYIVIFPDMGSPFSSIPYVDRVAQAFADMGYGDRVIRLFDQAEAMPLAERVVSNQDYHPSSAFHHLVGGLLYERFFARP